MPEGGAAPTLDVRFGSIASFAAYQPNVRFTPESRLKADISSTTRSTARLFYRPALRQDEHLRASAFLQCLHNQEGTMLGFHSTKRLTIAAAAAIMLLALPKAADAQSTGSIRISVSSA